MDDIDLKGAFIYLNDEENGRGAVFNMLQVNAVYFNERVLIFSNDGMLKTDEKGIEDIFEWMSGTKVNYSQLKKRFSNVDEQDS